MSLFLFDEVFKQLRYLFTLVLIFIFGLLAGRIVGLRLNEDEYYEKMLHQKTVIEQRIENTEDVETLYEEIEEFNNKIEGHKKYCDNLWFNLFYSKKIATIDYIQIKTFTQEVK